MQSLKDLPNISDVTAGKLIKAGIETPEELRKMGSKQAFTNIRIKVDDTACLSMLYGLEGAVQGIRWHGLDNKVKEDLKKYFNAL